MIRTRFVTARARSWLLIAAIAVGCRSKPAPPEPEMRTANSQPQSVTGTQASAVTTAASAPRVVSATPVATTAATAPVSSSSPSLGSAAGAPASSTTTRAPGGDPLNGKFELQDALKGLPKTGKLIAELVTDAGTLKCELYEDKAPNTVANFVGLARGLRPFKDPKTGVWEKRPAYDNGVFHRIIKGFMIQGGDPTGTGAGDGGFVIPDEVWPGATHDRRGLLCMANRGKHTNSMQFFIMDGAARHLDSGYTIFGSCSPDAVIEKLAASEVRGDRAVTPPNIK